MAIEKMTFFDIKGSSQYLDEVLGRCLLSGIFQPEYAAKLSEYSFGTTTLLRNPYGGLAVKINEIASRLRIDLSSGGAIPGEYATGDRDGFIDTANEYLNKMRKEYPAFYDKKSVIHDQIISYSTALDMVGHIDTPDINFDELSKNKYLKIRFGRIPAQNMQKLIIYEDKPYETYKLDSNAVQTWLLYFTAPEFQGDIDLMFLDLGFERINIPDYVHGTASDAKEFLRDGIVRERELLKQTEDELGEYISGEREKLISLNAQVKFLQEAYDLRKYVVSIREDFHLVGFVLTEREQEFKEFFADLAEVTVTATPAGGDKRIPAPVQLKNNWFVKPFEMFVNMYGSPSYNDIDPSPFVAYSYSLLFGMMFGDMGHGFCVFLLGILLGRFKKMQLGQIMSRIGVSSMGFGALYGSVFGFEHLLDWFYVGVLGLKGKPVHVMNPTTTNMILIAAIALGAMLILMVIIFNISIGVKHKDFDRTVLSPNGIAGLILYSVVLLALFENFSHKQFLSVTQEVILIVFPLIIVFFREPIANLIEYHSKDDIIKRDKSLSENLTFQEGAINIQELFKSQFVAARFGRIPTDSYSKLDFYENEPFMIYPVKTDHDYIWCIYTVANSNKEMLDAIFHGLLFERIFIPDECLKTNELAEQYIKRCVAEGGIPVGEDSIESAKYGPVRTAKPKTAMQTIFPDGVGAFFTQTFFEMFEVILSFITNTMSFLRVGGFILVHAGMMAVVFTLAEMVGGGASPVIIIIGNIFVMGLEGLIVGIQVLRLEFYEIFSRFFDADGEQFKPVTVSYADNNTNLGLHSK